jgi:glutamate 5-kinase
VTAGKSLLGAGSTEIVGDFTPKDAVFLRTSSGRELARGLVNYSSEDLRKILGCHSEDIPNILGYAGADTVIHRDNLVLTTQSGETSLL